MKDTGGHYYDTDTGGITGAVRRNFSSAKAEITSGSAGSAAIGTAIGFVAAGLVKRYTGGSA